MEEDLRAFVIADTVVSGLISTRMYPMALPQAPTFPSVSYSQISALRNYHMQGQDRLVFARMQIDAWSKTASESRTLANAIRSRLSGYQGSLGGSPPGTYVEAIFLESERTDRDVDRSGSISEVDVLYRVSSDYRVVFRES